MMIVVVALVLAACAAPAGPDTAQAPASPGFPLTIEHALGVATIPEAPTRIVALSFEEDVLARIGVSTVGHAGNSYAPGTPYPWQEGVVDLSGSAALGVVDGINLEAVAALDPDLILATNLFTLPDTYEQLSAIAPTVGYRTGWGEATWQETSRVIGQATGHSADVDREIGEVEKYVDDLAAALPGLAGATYSGGYYYESGTFAVGTDPDGQTGRLYSELGMVLSPRIVAEVVDRSLSLEQIGVLDADLVRIGFGSDELQAELTASPLYQTLPSVREGRVSFSDNYGATAGSNPTMLNIPWLFDEIRPVLERVAAAG